jgi:hypothetical protein
VNLAEMIAPKSQEVNKPQVVNITALRSRGVLV